MTASEPNPYLPPKSRVADVAAAGFPAVPRPPMVTLAVWALWADIAFEAVYKLYGAREEGQFVVTVSAASVGTLAMVCVLCWLIFMIGRRRNWARITYGIVFALGLSFFAVNWREVLDGPFRDLVSIVLQSILQLVAMVLLFLPSSSAWFRSRRVGA